MQSICLLFAGRRGLDGVEERHSILRIPEVSRRMKRAQALLDETLESGIRVDLYSFILSPDEEFNAHPSLKSLVTSVTQVGLFDRFIKYRSRPQFMIGRMNGCSAALVCSSQQTFDDFVTTSRFCQENTLMARYTGPGTQLAGVQMEEYGALQWNEEGFYEPLKLEAKDAASIMIEISGDFLITQCIHIGPHYKFRLDEFEHKGLGRISSMNSVEMDPILSSFWKSA